MPTIYNSTLNTIFELDSLKSNKPTYIYLKNKCLSVHKTKNIVFYLGKNIDNSFQEWVFESDPKQPDIYYIRSQNSHEGDVKYLGSPNKNNIVFLYTSKNRYTRWKVTLNDGKKNMYNIVYAGDKFDIKKHAIVVAVYNEPIDWLLPYNDIAIIYHKGNLSIPPFDNIIKLPNIGREGHTYLNHIVENFNTLSDRTTFIQGDPFLHNGTILYGIDNHEQMLPFQPLGLRWLEKRQIPPNAIINKYKTTTDYGLEYLVIKLNGNLNYDKEYYFKDKDIESMIHNYRREFRLAGDKIISENFLVRSKFPINYTNKSLHRIDFTFSALFSVVRTNIKIYDKEIYHSIMKELLMRNDQGGANGYILERLWCFIFDNI